MAALNKERKIHKEQQEDIDDNKIAINYSLILNVIGVTAPVVSLYYVKKAAVKKEQLSCQPKNVKEEQLNCQLKVKEEKPQKVLDTLE